jgi:hypothetical protein
MVLDGMWEYKGRRGRGRRTKNMCISILFIEIHLFFFVLFRVQISSQISPPAGFGIKNIYLSFLEVFSYLREYHICFLGNTTVYKQINMAPPIIFNSIHRYTSLKDTGEASAFHNATPRCKFPDHGFLSLLQYTFQFPLLLLIS